MQIPSNGELALRIALSVLLGGVVGLERELTGHPAGLRTHITVALGSALFAMTGSYGLASFIGGRDATNVTVAPDRVASTIVTGIGFLGGGAILKTGLTVKGLTTAGSLWVTAAIGMAVGFGNYFLGGVAAAAALVSLVGLRLPERWLRARKPQSETLVVKLRPDASPSEVMAVLEGLHNVTVRSMSLQSREGTDHLTIDVETAPGTRVDDALGPVRDHPAVEEVDTP